VKHSSFKDSEAVRSYVNFYVDNTEKVAQEALFVPLTAEQLKTAQSELGSIAG
jgi:phosphate transport system substrate-binding protein